MSPNLTIEEHLRYTDDIPAPVRAGIEQHLQAQYDVCHELKLAERRIEILEEQLYFAREVIVNIRESDISLKAKKTIELIIENGFFEP